MNDIHLIFKKSPVLQEEEKLVYITKPNGEGTSIVREAEEKFADNLIKCSRENENYLSLDVYYAYEPNERITSAKIGFPSACFDNSIRKELIEFLESKK